MLKYLDAIHLWLSRRSTRTLEVLSGALLCNFGFFLFLSQCVQLTGSIKLFASVGHVWLIGSVFFLIGFLQILTASFNKNELRIYGGVLLVLAAACFIISSAALAVAAPPFSAAVGACFILACVCGIVGRGILKSHD